MLLNVNGGRRVQKVTLLFFFFMLRVQLFGVTFSPVDFRSYLSKYCWHNSSRVDSSLVPGSLSKTGPAIQKTSNPTFLVCSNTKAAEEEEKDCLLFHQFFFLCISIPTKTLSRKWRRDRSIQGQCYIALEIRS